ncbi:HIT family protein [Aestuariivirga litoralis]|uniref:HIT family protein n=1 Tax=Aestuariivirga litoralis TaxID=2650924 RepID=UPI0018C7B73E|nr:HIT domain-containing protein [Aestuariivirga litoralis]MBG1231632.1 HIT domain-containing protein [Aestuariivirga litoralis]
MTYDSNNIFAKILRGEIPSHKIYEDEHTLAFMDVMPQCDGHCLVIPKAPSRGLLDTDPAVLALVMPVVQKVAKAAVAAMGADGFQLRQYNEAAAGQTVFHLHFHIFPMKEGVPLRGHVGKMADHEVLAEQAKAIKVHLT